MDRFVFTEKRQNLQQKKDPLSRLMSAYRITGHFFKEYPTLGSIGITKKNNRVHFKNHIQKKDYAVFPEINNQSIAFQPS